MANNMTPRVKLRNYPMDDQHRFKLSVNVRDITLAADGTLNFWIDRGEVSNLHLDCSSALLDDDLESGSTSVHELLS